MAEGQSKGFSDIFKDVLHSPAVLVTLIVGVVAVGYIIIKSNSSNNAAVPGASGSTGSASAQSPNGPGYYLQEDTIIEPPPTVNVTNTNNVPLPTTPPPTTTPAQYTSQGVEDWILSQSNSGRGFVDTVEAAQRAMQKKSNPDNKKKS